MIGRMPPRWVRQRMTACKPKRMSQAALAAIALGVAALPLVSATKPALWVPSRPAIHRPAEHALLKPGAFRPCTRAEGRAILSDLVRSGRMTPEQMLLAGTVFIDWFETEPTTTWSKTFSLNGTFTGAASVRNVISAANCSASGSRVRVGIEASTAAGAWNLSHVFIGVRSGSTSSTTVVPTIFTFGGNASVSLASSAIAFSDWLTYSFDKTVDHLIGYDQSASTIGARGVDPGGDGYYFSSTDTVTYDTTAVVGSPPISSTGSFGIFIVEVRA